MGRGEVTPFFCQCVYEAQDTNSVKAIFTSTDIGYSPESVANYDAFALGYCISGFNTWSLDFDELNGKDLKMMGHGMKSVKYGGGIIEPFKFSDSLGSNNENYLLNLPDFIKCLKFYGCEIDHNGLCNLAECIPHTVSLKELDINLNPGGPEGIPKLMQALREHRDPLSLGLSNMTFEMPDMTALLDLIRIKTSCAKTLSFTFYSLGLDTDSSCRVLQEIVSSSFVEFLQLFGFPVRVSERR